MVSRILINIHYLNQFWVIVIWIFQGSYTKWSLFLGTNFNLKNKNFLQENVPENVIHKLSAILFRPHWIISLGPLLLTWINSITAWISNHMLSKVGDEITYPFPNYNGFTVEVWEWISKFTSHFIMDVITYPYVNNRDHWRKESHM